MTTPIASTETTALREARADLQGQAVDRYLRQVEALVAGLPRQPIEEAIDLILDTGRQGKRIYILGNGGSAATASHMANDLCKQAAVAGVPPLRAMAMTDNVPLITAWSNDYDYDSAFAGPLRNHLEPGDLLIAISTSGRSVNVLRAVDLARETGARSIGLTGRDGGDLAARVDCCIHAPSDDVAQLEDAHLVVNHSITTGIRARLLSG